MPKGKLSPEGLARRGASLKVSPKAILQRARLGIINASVEGRAKRSASAKASPRVAAHLVKLHASAVFLAVLAKRRLRPYEHYIALIQRHCKRRKGREVEREFSLSYDDLLELVKYTTCFYCSSEIIWNRFSFVNGKDVYGRSNLDRKDNSKGYTMENVVPCCKRCNYGKGASFSFEEWYGMTSFLRTRERAVNELHQEVLPLV